MGTWKRTKSVAVVAGGMLSLTSCVSVQTAVRNDDTPLRMKRIDHGQVSAPINVSHSIVGAKLVVSVTEQPRCEYENIQIVDRHVVTERTDKGGRLWWEYGAAATFGGLGAHGVAGGYAPSAKDSPSSARDPSAKDSAMSPAASRGVGYGLIGLGAVALGVAIYDSVRVRDSVKYVGEVEVSRGKEVAACAPVRPVVARAVSLDLGGGVAYQSQTDERGDAVFIYARTAELPSAANPQSATVTISGGVRPVEAIDITPIIPPAVLHAREQKIAEEAQQAKAALCWSKCDELESGTHAFCLATVGLNDLNECKSKLYADSGSLGRRRSVGGDVVIAMKARSLAAPVATTTRAARRASNTCLSRWSASKAPTWLAPVARVTRSYAR